MQYLSRVERHASFEDIYLKVRGKENRLLDDKIVAQLPYAPEDLPNHKEWKVRARSFEKLKHYFQSLKTTKHLLDIGCGNGWAAAGLADNKLLNVSAIDINIEELEQAERVFSKPNLAFYYGDVFEDIFPQSSFDFIVLNSSAQYFDDLKKLIERLFYFLKEDGEIHIVDTPFYKDDELKQAKERTLQYYSALGCPEMANYYFHQRLSDLSQFNYETLPKEGFSGRLKSLFSSPLPSNFIWVRIRPGSKSNNG